MLYKLRKTIPPHLSLQSNLTNLKRQLGNKIKNWTGSAEFPLFHGIKQIGSTIMGHLSPFSQPSQAIYFTSPINGIDSKFSALCQNTSKTKKISIPTAPDASQGGTSTIALTTQSLQRKWQPSRTSPVVNSGSSKRYHFSAWLRTESCHNQIRSKSTSKVCCLKFFLKTIYSCSARGSPLRFFFNANFSVLNKGSRNYTFHTRSSSLLTQIQPIFWRRSKLNLLPASSSPKIYSVFTSLNFSAGTSLTGGKTYSQRQNFTLPFPLSYKVLSFKLLMAVRSRNYKDDLKKSLQWGTIKTFGTVHCF